MLELDPAFLGVFASKLLALYFYQVGFRFSELILLMAIPLFFYILPMENNLTNISVMGVGNKVIGLY